jgi:hypothetical protein
MSAVMLKFTGTNARTHLIYLQSLSNLAGLAAVKMTVPAVVVAYIKILDTTPCLCNINSLAVT